MSGNGVRSAALLALALASTLAARAPALAGGADLLAAIDRAGRAIVAAGCARPVESKTSRVGGGSSGAVDEMRAIDCRSFRAATWVERDAAQQRSAPMALVVLGVEPRLPAGIAVGATPAQVQALLGMPGLHRGHSFGYALGRAQPPRDTLTFELVDGRVSAISWNWAVD